MRRLLIPMLLCVAAAAFGCQTPPAAHGASGPQLERILAAGVLRVGLSGDQPPLNMRDASGELIGFDVDLADALAKSMGLEVQFVAMPFAKLLPAVEAGEVDLVISGVTITPQRNARVAFAGPYFISGQSVLAKKGTVASATVPDLDVAGRKYAAIEGSTSEAFVNEWLPRATVATSPDYDGAVARLFAGEVDAVVADYPLCAFTEMRHPEAELETLTATDFVEPLGIAVRAGDPLFVNLLENYIESLSDTGLLVNLRARWFSPGSWVDELP